MQNIQTIIIDDEPLAREIVRRYVSDLTQISVVAECGDGFDALRQIQELKPDLLFLDIQMPKLDGFELLEVLDYNPAIIFTTAFDEYAIKAFEAHAADYLLKPFSKERFDKAIQKVLLQNNNTAPDLLKKVLQSPLNTGRIVVKENGRIKIIPVAQVQYLEAADDYIRIHTAEGVFLKKHTMQYFEDSLPTQEFVRIHRSFIVNTQMITRIDLMEKESYSLLLTNGGQLPVSKAGYAKLKAVLGI